MGFAQYPFPDGSWEAYLDSVLRHPEKGAQFITDNRDGRYGPPCVLAFMMLWQKASFPCSSRISSFQITACAEFLRVDVSREIP